MSHPLIGLLIVIGAIVLMSVAIILDRSRSTGVPVRSKRFWM
jgi:ABC-type protease/lipase transport system fused ATPase/permease subunit